MIERLVNPSKSRASRIAATRPSIMSDGAIISAPALAWLTATRASRSSVGSLSTSCPLSRPQWPWSVYSHRQTSPITTRSGSAFLISAIARCTGLFMSQALEPLASLYSGRPNSRTAGMPSAAASFAASTA